MKSVYLIKKSNIQLRFVDFENEVRDDKLSAEK